MTGEKGSQVKTEDFYLNVWRKDGEFYIHLAELSIIVRDADLQTAYDKLEDSVLAALKEYADAGAEHLIPAAHHDQAGPAQDHQEGSPSRGIGAFSTFAVKTAIATVIVGLALIIGANFAITTGINSTIKSAVDAVPKLLSRDLATQAYNGMHELVERIEKASPEEREALRRDLQVIARELRPFIDEMTEPRPPQPGTPR